MKTYLSLSTALSCIVASMNGLAASDAQYDYNQELTRKTIRFIASTEAKKPVQNAVKSLLEALMKKNQPFRILVRQEGDAYTETDYSYDPSSATLSVAARSSPEVAPTVVLHLPHFSKKIDVHAAGKKVTLYLNPELSYDPPPKQ